MNILSLGAGYDSTYFWLKKNQPDIDAHLDFIEVDFSQVVQRKSTLIKEKAPLQALLGDLREVDTLETHEIVTNGYKLI